MMSCVFRLPGIYGPGRSALERLMEGKAHRIDLPGQIFSRVHVDDIAGGIIASFDGPAGVYNLSDDLPAAQNQVIVYAAKLSGKEPPPILSLEEANLSPEAQILLHRKPAYFEPESKVFARLEPDLSDL